MIFVAVNLAMIHAAYLTRNEGWRSVAAIWDRRNRWLTLGTTLVCLIILWPLLVTWILPLGSDLMTKALGGTANSEYFSQSPQFNLGIDLLIRLAHQLVVWKTPYRWVVILFSVLCLTGMYLMARHDRDQLTVVLVWVLLPLLPIAVFSYLSNIDFGTRRVIFTLPILMISMAYGLR